MQLPTNTGSKERRHAGCPQLIEHQVRLFLSAGVINVNKVLLWYVFILYQYVMFFRITENKIDRMK